MPHDLTALDGSGLMTTFAEINAWHSYAITELARARSREEAAEEAERAHVSEAWKDDWKGSVTAAKHNVNGHAHVASARLKVVEARAYRRLVEAIAISLEKDRETVSREITRRSNDYSGMRATRRLT